jgi:hypothetical protein
MGMLRIRNMAAASMLAALAIVFSQAVVAAPVTLEWADLIPPDEVASARRLPSGLVQHGELPIPPSDSGSAGSFVFGSPDDPIGAIDGLRGYQPPGGSIRSDLDGKEVRIAGYVTPIDFDGTYISEFLLVPYVGACIHVPPPPANQIVFVSGVENYAVEDGLLYPVWVTGTLRAVPLTTDLAEVGYQMEGATVERYE